MNRIFCSIKKDNKIIFFKILKKNISDKNNLFSKNNNLLFQLSYDTTDELSSRYIIMDLITEDYSKYIDEGSFKLR